MGGWVAGFVERSGGEDGGKKEKRKRKNGYEGEKGGWGLRRGKCYN